MIQVEDLVQLADDLRQRGVDACHEILYGPHGGLEGLDVGDDFFPLWELTLPENLECLERADFAAIKSRRGPDWTIEPPWLERECRVLVAGS
jgi:hypothetical protein